LSAASSRRRCAVARIGAVLALVAATADERPRAAGGVRLVEALEAAPAAVVAVVADPRQVDAHGYTARLSVERALTGRVPAGAELRIGWEELASSRAPRFATGELVLVALEPLAGDSIWAKRFPDVQQRANVFGVARRGDAFLRAPSPRAIDRLEHYLKLAPGDREGASGVALLAELAAHAEAPLAVGAAQRLARHPRLEETLDPGAAALVVRALQRTDAGPELSAALLEVIARERPPALRAPLEALAAREEIAPAVVFEALAALDAGVAPAHTARLRSASPAHREVAARHASGPTARAELAQLARRDPAPAVRAAAIERLVEIGGASAVDDGLTALHDPDPSVRGAAARALGGLGAESVAGLRRTVEAGDADAARAAVVALQLTGSSEAAAALAEIAETHRDESVRTLARIALGRGIGHEH
jgi:hypothetical protein